MIAKQILSGNEGEIHDSYYLPENYNENKTYPLMMVMPGYDMMWFGEESSGSNLDWRGFRVWTELSEDMIVVSAQLTDWHEKSARQAVELTEYFIQNFPVDQSRVYAAGYSAGGETMSQAVAMRPDLYVAYLHGASQWDGTYEPIAKKAWQCISLWQKMMNIMVLRKQGMPMMVCEMLISPKDGQMNRLMKYCRWRFRIMSISIAGGYTIVLGVIKKYSQKQQKITEYGLRLAALLLAGYGAFAFKKEILEIICLCLWDIISLYSLKGATVK